VRRSVLVVAAGADWARTLYAWASGAP
jgi:hypothetical protein